MEPPVIVLALDTSTPAVVAGLVQRAGPGQRLLAKRVTVGARAHAERLTPQTLAALADAGLTFTDVDAVVVGCGPGPFTGLRVGMASAAAYGHALGVPVHGVCSLDAIGVLTAGPVLVVTDARRREVYWARYHDGARVEGPLVNGPADVPAGSAAAVAGWPDQAALFHLPRLAVTHPTPQGLVGAVGDWTATPAAPAPMYLRRPDARTPAERAAVRA